MAINAQDALHVLGNVLAGALTVVLDVEMIAPKAAQVYAAAVALLHVVVLVLAHAQDALPLVVVLVIAVVEQAVLALAEMDVPPLAEILAEILTGTL